MNCRPQTFLTSFAVVLAATAHVGSAQCYTNAEVILSGTNPIREVLPVRLSSNPDDPERLFLRSLGGTLSWVEYQPSTRRMLPVSAARQLISIDFDGSGPQGSRLVRANGLTVESFDGSAWTPLPTGGGALPQIFFPSYPPSTPVPFLTSWDHDSNPATPAWLMAIAYNVPSLTGSVGLFRYVPAGVNSYWEYVVDLGRSLATNEGGGNIPKLLVTTVDVDGPGSIPNRLYVSRVATNYDVVGINPNFTAVTFPHPFTTTATPASKFLTADPDGPGPLPTSLYALTSSRIFRYDPAGFDGLFWVDAGSFPTFTVGSFDIENLSMSWADPDGSGPLASTLVIYVGTGGPRSSSWRYEPATNAWVENTSPFRPTGLARLWDRNPGVSPPVPVAGDESGLYTFSGTSWSELEAWLGNGLSRADIWDAKYLDVDGSGPAPAAYYLTGAIQSYGLQTFTTPANNRVIRVNLDRTATEMGAGFNQNPGDVYAIGGELYVTTSAEGSVAYWLNPSTNAWQAITPPGNKVRYAVAWDADGSGPLPERFTTVLGRDVVQWNGTALVTVASVPNFATTTGFDLRAITLWDADGSGPNPPRLVVAGERQRPAGPVAYIGMFDGANWQTVGDLGTGVSVQAGDPKQLILSTWDPDASGPLTPRLLVAPIFAGASGASGVPITRVGAWTGTSWVDIAIPDVSGTTNQLFSWDPDGSGPLNPLVAASQEFNRGLSTWSNGVSMNWGNPFVNPGALIPYRVFSTMQLENDASGREALLVDLLNEGLVRFYCPAPSACPADVAGANQSIGPNGTLTADDIIVFLSWYFASDSRADIAGNNQSLGGNGAFTADDIIVYLGQFFAGCP